MVRKDWNEHLSDCESLVPLKSFDKFAAALELAVKQRNSASACNDRLDWDGIKRVSVEYDAEILAVLKGM